MEYPKGQRVRLVSWDMSGSVDENKVVPPGTEGTSVGLVDGMGTIAIDWDNGAKLGVTTEDHIEKV